MSAFLKFMSADGSVESSWVKVELLASDDIADFAKRACKELRSWDADASRISLFLVAAAGADEPQAAAIAVVIADDGKRLRVSKSLSDVDVHAGSWLVARATAGAAAAGGALAAGGPAPRADLLAHATADGCALAPAFPPLPPPLVFVCEDVGGEEVMVASLGPAVERDAAASAVPFFLTLAQHTGLLRFVRGQPVYDTPQMLMATGTIKSGKTKIVHEILPRLVVAEHLRAAAAAAGASPPVVPPRHPIFFKYTFPMGKPAEDAASDFVRELTHFTLAQGLPKPLLDSRTPTEALQDLPRVVEELARGIHARGCMLWLLLDELQAPIVFSTPAQAGAFMEKFKTAVRLASPCARVVGTGSGMVSLLAAIRGMPSNGFALWDAVAHMGVGREPPPRAALAMADRIVAAYGAAWPAAAKAFLMPQRFVNTLARNALGELTSARPALVAHMAGLCGDAQSGSPEKVFESATRALTRKLAEESTRDAVLALTRMRQHELLRLRALAVSGTPLADSTTQPLTAQAFDALTALLCEEGVPPRLLPPYGALFCSWITATGQLAVGFRVEDNNLDLAVHVRKNLIFLADNGSAFSDSVKRAASARVLASLVSNGVGTVEQVDGVGTVVRAPATPEEVRNVPAIAGVLDALEMHIGIIRRGLPQERRGGASSAEALRKTLLSPLDAPARNTLMADLGLTVLKWVRNFDAHVWFEAPHVYRNGLSGAVVTEAVAAAVGSLLERREGAVFAFSVDANGILQHASSP